MAKIALKEAWKSFGKATVLSGVDWSLEAGELVALMGVNGAGKTTFLRILAGLVGTDSGSVEIGGKVFLRDDVELRRQFFFLGDEPALFPEESAVGNLAIMGKLWQKKGSEFEDAAAHWMEEFGILPLREKAVEELSRGQRYKVALTILASLHPPVWLLDEPFASGMDAQGLRAFRRLIRGAVDRGAAVVFSTQLIEMVRDFAQRVTVLNGGVMLHDGSVSAMEQEARAGHPYLAQLMD